MKQLILLVVTAFLITSCGEGPGHDSNSSTSEQNTGIDVVSYDKSQIYPGPGSLRRPEDGQQLPDGRLIVSDEYSGMWLVEEEGYGRPFGKFAKTGFKHDPPAFYAGPNGMTLEPDAKHLLMGDISTGKLYRVNVETEEVTVIYQHEYGINSVLRDSKGNIWFTQSCENELGTGMAGLLTDIDTPTPNGAIYRLDGNGNEISDSAQLVVSGLFFANGITLDSKEKFLYVSETTMDRILRFRAAAESGILVGGEVFWKVTTPDNLLMDSHDRLYVASPIENRVYMIDPADASMHVAFEAPSAANKQYHMKWMHRVRKGEKVSDLLTPDMTRPLSGLLTGMFFSNDEQTLYVTGTGTSILKCPAP